MIHMCRARHVCVWVSAGKQSECHAVPGGGIQAIFRCIAIKNKYRYACMQQ